MEVIAFLALFGFLGYVLGIVGFFRAGAALGEVRDLRRLLAAEIRPRSVGEVASAPAAPEPGPMADPAGAVEAPAALEIDSPAVEPGAVEAPAGGLAPPEPVAPSIGAPPLAPEPGRADIESVLTMRWAVWLGAVALLLAGVFLVRYASDRGLLGPATRCCAAVVLGLALIATAEWLRRFDLPAIEGPFDVDQAPPALAAGGVAVLFGAAYGAGPFYGLLPPLVAYAAMATASFLGLVVSLRFGPLTAAVGIVGAFVTPELVPTSSPSLVGLFAYLALATAAAHAVVRRTAWTWLGWAVAIAGAIWVVVVAAGEPSDAGIWAAALFVPASALLGLILPPAAMDVAIGRALAWGQFATLALAGLVLQSLAPGYAPRAAVLFLTPVAVWKGAVEPRLDRLPWLAAGCGLAALWLWNGFGSAIPGDLGPALLGSPLDDGAGALLATAIAFALASAAAGLWMEARAPEPSRWAALAAAVPVIALAVCYARVGRFEADPRWGLVGLLLAASLTGFAARAMRLAASNRAGVHAAGAIAALALALATTLRQQWLGTALSLMLPGLAWVEARTGLAALRVVSTVVAVVVFALVPGWFLHDVALGHPSAAGDPLTAYALPAAMAALAARIFRRRSDDALVALLEAGTTAAAALFVLVEVRLLFGNGVLDGTFGFGEVTTLMLTAAVQAVAYDRAARRNGRATAKVAGAVLGAAAYLLAVGLLLDNPMLSGALVGAWSLVLAYLAPGVLAAWVAKSVQNHTVRLWLRGYAVAAGFAWTTLQVRLWFHPGATALSAAPVTQTELWCWSAGWLLYGLALMIAGVRLNLRALRLTALALVGLVCLKVFLVDMGKLTGLLRVASFLGLGLVLIGLGALHRRYVLPLRRTDAAA